MARWKRKELLFRSMGELVEAKRAYNHTVVGKLCFASAELSLIVISCDCVNQSDQHPHVCNHKLYAHHYKRICLSILNRRGAHAAIFFENANTRAAHYTVLNDSSVKLAACALCRLCTECFILSSCQTTVLSVQGH
jgi:hypothetical protein